jgi:NADH dehydrogenase
VKRKQVVIVGAGFGGLAAAKALSGRDVTVTLIDRTNHHLFQPLLYQVATAALAPSDIATATRTLMAGYGNVTTLLDEVAGVDDAAREVLTASGERIRYDYLVLATGCSYSFFGNDEWAEHAPVLKTLADALSIRERLLDAFERAERSVDASEIASLLTFVVVGGGPTGVEMAGAIAELAKTALARDFRNIGSDALRIMLVEAGSTILSAFPDDLPGYAAAALTRLGVEVMLGAPVRSIDADGLQVGDTRIDAATVIWAAGTRANEAAAWLGADAARNGALRVLPDCSVKDRPHVFAIGDVASFTGSDGKPLPGLAPVAKQQGRYVGELIWNEVQGRRTSAPFRYRNWGSMAVIGRSHAVADFGTIRLRGFIAWLSWSLVHLMLLVDFRSRLTVYVNWAWSWFTRGRGVRLLTRATHSPLAKPAGASNLIPEGRI